jgi:hypothetical protein
LNYRQHYGWPKIDVVGEEITWFGDAQVPHAGSNDTDERTRNLRLNVPVIPGEAGAY